MKFTTICDNYVKAALLLLVFVFTNIASTQTQFRITITATNATSTGKVEIGWDRTATHCIDSLLGEQEQPPIPPSEIFDFRTIDNRTPNCLGEGLVLDLKRWTPGVTISDTFVIKVQQGAGGYPVTLTWPTITNPDVKSLILQDGLGGMFVNKNMLTENSASITNQFARELYIYSSTINDVKKETELPTRFGLDQNYPNPFNPSTKIKFSIPVQSNVEISVFDVLGRKIRTLVSEVLEASVYSVEWNGKNNSEAMAASGIYYIKMTANSANNSFTETRKVVLMK